MTDSLSKENFLLELKNVLVDADKNFSQRETNKIIVKWQAEIFAAARQGKRSVDIFLDLFPNKFRIDDAAKYFNSINLKTRFHSKYNHAKSHDMHYVEISWDNIGL